VVPLRVLQVHNSYREAGGEDTVVAKEAALLRQAGHVVLEYQVANPEAMLPAVTSLLAAPWNPRSARRMRDFVLENRPDVAHVHNTWWALSPSVVSTLTGLGLPVVVTLHNYRLLCANALLFRNGAPCEDCVGGQPWHGVRHRCYRDSLPGSLMAAGTIALNRRVGTWDSVALFLALTEFAREMFVAAGFQKEKLRVKPNFVDDPGERAGRPSESNVVLFVGRLSNEKGIPVLLEAWSTLEQPDMELVLVGDGPLRSSLDAAGFRNVRILGPQPPEEVRRLMLSARALVFPSVVYEGQPMVLLEALAAGLPLAISDVAGIPGTVGNPNAAHRAVPGDPQSWAVALAGLGNDTWVDSAGEAGRAVFEARYTPAIGLNELQDAYAQAMAVTS